MALIQAAERKYRCERLPDKDLRKPINLFQPYGIVGKPIALLICMQTKSIKNGQYRSLPFYKENQVVGNLNSKKAEEHISTQLFVEREGQADRIIAFYNNHFDMKIQWTWGRKNRSLLGTAYIGSQRIILWGGKSSFSTLLHEIAHHVEFKKFGSHGHGPKFYESQDLVIDLFDLHAHEFLRFDKFPKSIVAIAEEVVERDKKSKAEVEDLISIYAEKNGVDEDELLEAVIERS